MCKILLADDEYYILSGLTRLIEENFPSAGVYAYSSGLDAMEALSRVNPDIIVSDIRMGEFSGLDFIQGVRRLYPDTQVMIISGYNDFDYARRAIELGVARYILKPICQEQMVEFLREAMERVQAMKELRERQKFSLEAARQRVVAEVLASGVADARADREMRMAGLTPLMEDYIVASLNVYEYQMAAPYDNANQMKNLRRFIGGSAARAMKELDAGEHLFVDALRGNLVLIARCGTRTLEEALRRVSLELFETFSLRSDFVISARHRGAAELFAAYCESQGIQLTGDAFSVFDDAELRLVRQIQELKRQMADAIARDTPAQVGAKLQMVAEMLARGYDANAMAIAFCQDLMGVAGAIARGREDAPAEAAARPPAARVSALLPEIEALKRELAEYHARCVRRRADDLVDATKRFIRENLAETTQESVAAHVGVSAIYLSMLFKEVTGENFRDYLIAAKIDRAKRLLAETDGKVYEIALQTGYSDIKYFSKNFRRLVGVSPNEYRAAARNGK